MESEERTWIFVISLVAVINGLGIVRLLGGLSEYFRNQKTLDFQHYWVYTLFVLFQLLLHLLFWWSIVGLHKVGNLNYLSYLYLLIGPTMLFLGTSLLVPAASVDLLNFRSEYYGVRKKLFFHIDCILALGDFCMARVRPCVCANRANTYRISCNRAGIENY